MKPVNDYSCIIFDFDETIATIDVDWVSLRPRVRTCIEQAYPEMKSVFAAAEASGQFFSTERLGTITHEALGKDVYELFEDMQVAAETAFGPEDFHMIDEPMVAFIRANAKDKQLVLCTNNSRQCIDHSLPMLGLETCFTVIETRIKGRPPKPHTQILDDVFAQVSVSKDDVLYVGNSDASDRALADAYGIAYMDHEEFSQLCQRAS